MITGNYRDNHAHGWINQDYKAFRKAMHDRDHTEIVRHVDEHIPGRIKVLDIGGGTGETLLSIIHNPNKIISIDYVDVSKEHAKQFIENLSRRHLEYAINRMNIKSWEQFEPQEKYSVILAVHSWYGVSEEPEHLRKLADCLAPGGFAYMVLARKGDLWDRISCCSDEGRATGQDIMDMLEKENIPYKVKPIYDNQFSVSDLFTGRRLTRAGKNAVSYILLEKYRKLPKIKKRKIIKVFRDQATRLVPDDLIIIPGKK